VVESAPPTGFSDRQRLHQRGRRVRLRSHAASACTLRIQFAGKNFKNYSFQFESKTIEYLEKMIFYNIKKKIQMLNPFVFRLIM
jgi:hypothetical protein